LHFRFGHVGYQRLQSAVYNRTCIGLCTTWKDFKKNIHSICMICYIAKFKKFPVPKSLHLNEAEQMFTITMDYKQFNIRSQRGYKYFTLILHVGTSYLFAILAKTKSEMADQLINIQKTHLNKHNILKRMHSDSDSIYKSNAVRTFAAKNDLYLTFSAPYRHEGSIEAYMQSVLDMLRAMMIDGDISPKLWDYILMYAVIPTINCFPNNKFPKSSPYQQLFGKPPDVSKFRPMGYPTLVWLDKSERSHKHPNQPKAVVGSIISYSDEVKDSYLVLVKNRIYTRLIYYCQ
jgi:hypothetical protein